MQVVRRPEKALLNGHNTAAFMSKFTNHLKNCQKSTPQQNRDALNGE